LFNVSDKIKIYLWARILFYLLTNEKRKILVIVHPELFHFLHKLNRVLKFSNKLAFWSHTSIDKNTLFGSIKYVLHNSDKLVLLNEYTQNFIQCNYINKKTLVIRNPIIGNSKSGFENTTYDSNCIKLFYGGRFDRDKSILELINLVVSYNINHRNKQRIQLYIAGDINKEKYPDLEYFSKIENIVHRVDCVFLIGWLNRSSMIDYYSKMDYTVLLTKTREGSPSIIGESLSCGTPLILSNLPVLKEHLIVSEFGIVLEDVINWRGLNGLTKVKSEQREKIRNLALEHFNLKTNSNKLLSFIINE
jgi:glycosyltransferase involved in cell wall biosynthesis